MADTSNSGYISVQDSKRLASSFFSLDIKKDNKLTQKKVWIVTIGSLIGIAVLGAFLFNFNVVFIPKHNKISRNDSIMLFRNEIVENIIPINFVESSKIAKDIIYVDMPLDKKTGFSINFTDKVDLSNSKIVILAKRPYSAFSARLVLRDTNFFSNASIPIEVKVPECMEKSGFNEIPIDWESDSDFNFSLFRINQMRFVFSQKGEDFLPLLIKNIFIKKRR